MGLLEKKMEVIIQLAYDRISTKHIRHYMIIRISEMSNSIIISHWKIKTIAPNSLSHREQF